MSYLNTLFKATFATLCFKAGLIATFNFTQLAAYAQLASMMVMPQNPIVVTTGILSTDLVGSADEAYIMYPD
jgi:hypothetical protein